MSVSLFVAGSMRAMLSLPCRPTQIEPAPCRMHVGEPFTGIVFTTLCVFALMREIENDCAFDAHAEPKPNATSHGFLPTKIRFVTFIVAGLMRRMAFW